MQAPKRYSSGFVWALRCSRAVEPRPVHPSTSLKATRMACSYWATAAGLVLQQLPIDAQEICALNKGPTRLRLFSLKMSAATSIFGPVEQHTTPPSKFSRNSSRSVSWLSALSPGRSARSRHFFETLEEQLSKGTSSTPLNSKVELTLRVEGRRMSFRFVNSVCTRMPLMKED